MFAKFLLHTHTYIYKFKGVYPHLIINFYFSLYLLFFTLIQIWYIEYIIKIINNLVKLFVFNRFFLFRVMLLYTKSYVSKVYDCVYYTDFRPVNSQNQPNETKDV